MSDYWYIWLIIGVLFIVAEIFTSGFVLLWFGVGAVVAALLSATGFVGLPLQVIIFLSVSIALTIASRTIFERFLMRRLSRSRAEKRHRFAAGPRCSCSLSFGRRNGRRRYSRIRLDLARVPS